jgi:hypothetical protein
MKVPSSKFQVPKACFAGIDVFWILGFGAYLELGTWNLEL